MLAVMYSDEDVGLLVRSGAALDATNAVRTSLLISYPLALTILCRVEMRDRSLSCCCFWLS